MQMLLCCQGNIITMETECWYRGWFGSDNDAELTLNVFSRFFLDLTDSVLHGFGSGHDSFGGLVYISSLSGQGSTGGDSGSLNLQDQKRTLEK